MRTYLELAALLTAPGCARDHVSAVLREWRADADLTDTATLITSEILTNAVLSARVHSSPDPVCLWALSDGTNVLLMVWDATMPAPVTGTAAGDAEHGRGLTLVDALSARWGYYHPDRPPGGNDTVVNHETLVETSLLNFRENRDNAARWLAVEVLLSDEMALEDDMLGERLIAFQDRLEELSRLRYGVAAGTVELGPKPDQNIREPQCR